MAALLPGFEYDVFISYRHNDNLDGWVTDFIAHLEKDLRGIVKEPLSIYHDNNSHDGLLETHHVDKSLEGKLKCLVFIPIVSQTYCDLNSFAWRNEFCAFNKLAKEDGIGRDIKLHSGNVSSRILPIKIHELDADDKAAIEKELGAPLRAIEFVYKHQGVNRPLMPTDSPEKNQNKTLYRDQINKTANAVKEIVHALAHPAAVSQAVDASPATARLAAPKRPSKAIAWAASIIAVAALAAGYFFYARPQPTKEPTVKETPSIAVLPFADMSPNKDQEYFCDGLSEELLNKLANLSGLRVTGRTSSFAFKGKNDDLRKIGETLGVANLLEGSIRREGDRARITAQLIRTSDGFHLWSETYDRDVKDHFALQTDIAEKVANALNVLLDDAARERMRQTGARNIEAFIAYQKGLALDALAHSSKTNGLIKTLQLANAEYEKATALEPALSEAWYWSNDLYGHLLIGGMALSLDARREALANMQRVLSQAVHYAHNDQQRAVYEAVRQYISDDWRGLDARLRAIAAMPGCTPLDWAGSLSTLGFAREIAEHADRITRCDPISPSAWGVLSIATQHSGNPQGVLDILDRLPPSISMMNTTRWRVDALLGLGRISEAQALSTQLDAFNRTRVEIRIARMKGQDAKSLIEQYRLAVRSMQQTNPEGSRNREIILNALAGDLNSNDPLVAQIDAQPGRVIRLMSILGECDCGAPWRIEATPNFLERLREANIKWPPVEIPIPKAAR